MFKVLGLFKSGSTTSVVEESSAVHEIPLLPMTGTVNVDRRRTICNQCEHRTLETYHGLFKNPVIKCGKCGCALSVKTKMTLPFNSTGCPLKKW